MLNYFKELEAATRAEELLKTNPDEVFEYSGADTVDFRNRLDREIGSQRYCNTTVRNLYLGDYVNKIGRQAFFNVKVLNRVTIPKSVQSIEFNAFASESIKHVTVEETERGGTGIIFANAEINFSFKKDEDTLINVIQPKTKYNDIRSLVLETFTDFVRHGFKMDKYVETIMTAFESEFANTSVLYSMLLFVMEFRRLSEEFTEETLRDLWISSEISLDESLRECKTEQERRVVSDYFSVFWNSSKEEPMIINEIKEKKQEERWNKVKRSIEVMTTILRESPQYLYQIICNRKLYHVIAELYQIGIIDDSCKAKLQYLGYLKNNTQITTALSEECVPAGTNYYEDQEEFTLF